MPWMVSSCAIRGDFLLETLKFIYMEAIKIFQNERFGQVRIVVSNNGEPLFCAKDVATSLGYSDTNDAISRHCKSGKKVFRPHANGVGGVNFVYIPEKDVYRLIMRSNLPDAEKFQDWVCDEVLPSIRSTGQYSLIPPSYQIDDPIERAEAWIREQKEKKRIELENAETKLCLERKTQQLDESAEWFSIKRFANENGFDWRSFNWRVMKALSFELGYEIKKIFDANYGQVNIYHKDVFGIYMENCHHPWARNESRMPYPSGKSAARQSGRR